MCQKMFDEIIKMPEQFFPGYPRQPSRIETFEEEEIFPDTPSGQLHMEI